MYLPPRISAEGTGGSNESTRINAKIGTKATFRKKSSRQEKKTERLLGLSSSSVVGVGETERQRDRGGGDGTTHPSQWAKRRHNLPPRTVCMMMRVGFRPVRGVVGRLALIRKLPLESLGTAPSQRRSVTSHCDGQREWLRCQGYVQSSCTLAEHIYVLRSVQNSPYVLALWRQVEYWYLVLRLVQNRWWYLVSALSR